MLAKSLLLPSLILCSLLLGLGPDATFSWALSDSEIEARIEEALSQRHPTDTGSFWKGLGPEAPRVVRSMLTKASSNYHRVRLIEALGYFEDSTSREEIQRLVSSSETQTLRIAAVRAAGRNPALLETVTRALGDADPQLRVTAARVLKSHPAPEAKARLEEFLAQEKQGWVVAAVKGGSSVSELTRGAALVPSQPPGAEEALKSCAGEWEGVLLHPKAGKIGLHTLPVRLEIPARGSAARFQILLPIPSRFAVSGALARTRCVGGVLKFATPPQWAEAIQVFDRSVTGAPTGKPLPVEWLLLSTQEGAEMWLESRAHVGTRLLLRKSDR